MDLTAGIGLLEHILERFIVMKLLLDICFNPYIDLATFRFIELVTRQFWISEGL